MKTNTITLPAKTYTLGHVLDKHFNLLSKTDQARLLVIAQRALNKATANV